jgi:hypothetical protein
LGGLKGGFVKLRMRGNSLRLRLGQSEVNRLTVEGMVEEVTMFGGGRGLSYAVCAVEGLTAVGAALEGQRIVVRVPGDMARRWAESEEAGIEAVQKVGQGAELKILLEKDFECLQPVKESQADAFANPKKGCGPGGG